MTTLEGLDDGVRERLVAAFDATAASQCGFCTPGILVRLAGQLPRRELDEASVRTALSAHLCRCTGFQPIVEAALVAQGSVAAPPARDLARAAERAELESGAPQRCGPDVCRGEAPFADDAAPSDALVALATGAGDYAVGDDERLARARSGARQGRNSGAPLCWPVPLPEGDFDVVLQTTFVEPAYLEPDASWCAPHGEPASPSSNAGDFGAKRGSTVAEDAAALARAHGRPVVARWTREAVVLRGEKRPPVAIGLRRDGTGVLRLARTPGSSDLAPLLAAVRRAAPRVAVETVEVLGPRVGTSHRGAGLAELLAARAVLDAGADGTCSVETPNGARASVRVEPSRVVVTADAGDPRCTATTRSYVLGAVHQGFSMVRSEGIALDACGVPLDLTIRSFGIVPARGFPPVVVELARADRPPVAVGAAVFAATLAAVWLAEGVGPRWPTRR